MPHWWAGRFSLLKHGPADRRVFAGRLLPRLNGSLHTFGARSDDRTPLAAGAVLGATAVVAAGALARGIRSAVGLVRR